MMLVKMSKSFFYPDFKLLKEGTSIHISFFIKGKQKKKKKGKEFNICHLWSVVPTVFFLQGSILLMSSCSEQMNFLKWPWREKSKRAAAWPFSKWKNKPWSVGLDWHVQSRGVFDQFLYQITRGDYSPLMNIIPRIFWWVWCVSILAP